MILETKGVTKKFGEEYALNNININIKKGEIHGLVGENGAGKSTLIKILTGVYTLDQGEVIWDGSKVNIKHPMESRKLGMNVIHQDRHLIPAFSGIENIYLGLDYERKLGVAIDWKKMKNKVEKLMEELSIEVPLNIPAINLTPPQRTMIEIIRAMMTECKLLILDEPTASLTDREVEILFRTILKLREKGTSILYVTHRMDEIFRITDRITVFKNGTLMKTLITKETRLEEIVSLMTDNWLSNKLKSSHQIGEEVMVVDGIHTKDNVVKAGSFTVHRGEILGIFGLGGSGRTELLEGVYGFRATESGKVSIDNKPYQKRTPNESIKRGMVLISEDRRGKALVNSLSVRNNITLSKIDDYSDFGVMNQRKEIDDVEDKIKSIGIKTKGYRQKVSELSGGNQQKVVFAKSLLTNPIIYLCDEPTQAVDIRTREEIHNLLREKAQEGNAVVFVSSDLKEILDVADNIQIIREGRTTVLLHNENLSSEEVLSHCYAG